MTRAFVTQTHCCRQEVSVLVEVKVCTQKSRLCCKYTAISSSIKCKIASHKNNDFTIVFKFSKNSK